MPKAQAQVWVWNEASASSDETPSRSTDEGTSTPTNPTATNCQASYASPTNGETMHAEM